MPGKRSQDKRLLNVWVHQEFYDYLTRRAKEERTNKSEMMRMICWEWYHRGAKLDKRYETQDGE